MRRTPRDQAVSLMKSATQKAVRRNKPESAVACVRLMGSLDPIGAARRMAVIALEDAILHPDYDLLLSPGPIAEKLDAMVRIAWASAICPVRDAWPEINPDMDAARAKGFDNGDVFRLAVDRIPNAAHKALVLSLLRRSSSGGIPWDVTLLYQYAQIWTWRFLHHKGKDVLRFVPRGGPRWKDVEPARDCIPESVDHHCSSILWKLQGSGAVLNVVKKEYPREEVKEVLKQTIWTLRAGVNFKPTIQTKKPMVYLRDLKRYRDRWGADVQERFTRIYKVIEPMADDYSVYWRKKVFTTPATRQEDFKFPD